MAFAPNKRKTTSAQRAVFHNRWVIDLWNKQHLYSAKAFPFYNFRLRKIYAWQVDKW
jgi:hypothetical protein